MTAPTRPLRVLVVHSELLARVYEASEVWQIVTGLLLSAEPGELELTVSDTRRLWCAVLVGERAQLGAQRTATDLRRGGFDVVHIHLPIPLRHLWWGLRYRLRGVPVVFSPMALLSDDFAQASWYRNRHPLFRGAKPLLVRLLRWAWHRVSTVVICLSREERRQTRVPARRCLLAPWPLPDTPLAAAATSGQDWPPAAAGDRDGPAAFVARLDPWRKGLDRVCAWLAAHGAHLPRPAVLLLAPAGDRVPAALQRPLRDGLVEWDTATRGAALVDRLRGCRAAILLSRWEAQPRALREAVLVGLPTISTPSAHFSEVVEVLRCGAVVDGDDVDAVQAAFESVAGRRPLPGATRALFSPHQQGRWLLDVLRAVAARMPVAEPDYYRWAADVAPTLAGR